jgi:hypothetical protein
MLAVAGVFVLAGCGSGVPGRAGGGPITPDRPAPPIIATNESPPDDIAWFLKLNFGEDQATPSVTGHDFICEQSTAGGVGSLPSSSCPQPGAEQIAQMEAEAEEYAQAIRPASGTDPQVVAKLELGNDQELLFTRWRTSAGAPCWEVDQEGPDGSGGGGGPSGPCVGEAQAIAYPSSSLFLTQNDVTPCTALCLDSVSVERDDQQATDFALQGTVPADAQALRITLADGATATYPLVGPRFPDASLRIFMVDLGAHDWRKVELIRNASVSSTATMPATQAAYEDCAEQVGPPPTPTLPATTDDDTQAMLAAMKPYDDALNSCIASKTAGR